MSLHSLVMAVTQTFGIDLLLTAVDSALASLSQWPGRTRTSGPQYPAVVHLAVPPGVHRAFTTFYLAFLPHEHNVSAATDGFPSGCAS